MLDGPVGNDILHALDARGLHGLGFWESGFKQMTSSVRPVRGPEDLHGVKVRTMQSPLLIAQYKDWGANPVPIAFSETYNALQQGVADALGRIAALGQGAHVVLGRQHGGNQFGAGRDLALAHPVEGALAMMGEGGERIEGGDREPRRFDRDRGGDRDRVAGGPPW